MKTNPTLSPFTVDQEYEKLEQAFRRIVNKLPIEEITDFTRYFSGRGYMEDAIIQLDEDSKKWFMEQVIENYKN